jgi:Na+/melibiose symporter-like transporter
VSSKASPDAARPERRLSVLDQFYISCLWLAYNAQWVALLPIVLPDQIAAIVGPAKKELYNGLIPPIGAAISLLITPIAGALSDRSRSRFGRRRPFILTGGLINILFLLAIAGFGKGSSVWLFMLVYMGIQLGCNWMGGPYAGLIPDVVPESQRGSASGWMAVMQALGTVVGAVSAGVLLAMGARWAIRGAPAPFNGPYWPIYTLIVVLMLFMLGLTLWRVRETPSKRDPGPFHLATFLRSFLLDPQRYRNFYWVLLTRGMVTMGMYSVYTFFQYFLGDVIKVPHPEQQTGNLLAIITLTSIPTSIVAGILSDRYGRKPLVYLAGGIMALACTIFIAVGRFPSMTFTLAVAALFGLGYGAYSAVDWALGIDVLPAGEDVAKDMGIWHVSMVLPQMIAPAISGLVLTAFKDGAVSRLLTALGAGTTALDAVRTHALLLGYTVIFAIAAAWFILGTVFVRQIRGVS